jgi:hypothetical protein
MAPRWRTGTAAALALLAGTVPFLDVAPAQAATVHPLHFPVEAAVHFTPSFGAARDGGARQHEGNDLLGERLLHVLAATDGTVTKALISSGTAGNELVVTAPDGWVTKYLHLNNDTPGTDDGVFSFGAAAFHGSTGGLKLNQLVVGLAPTATGGGYWLVASDGGAFTFGDARFLGSTGSLELNEPIVDMAPTPSGNGHGLLGRDGGLFGFGDAADV